MLQESFLTILVKLVVEKIKHKDVLGMNLKFRGRNINEFYCKKHLKEALNINDEQWDYYIKSFKQDKCELF